MGLEDLTPERVLVTGGAGFIGSNLADRLLAQGHDVTLFDNLSRRGGERNIEWLRERHGAASLTVTVAELADSQAVRRAVDGMDRIYHLGGQVAVTTSVQEPRRDFEANALGTFNLLEAVRLSAADAILVYASTNKVYGGMEDQPVVEEVSRYRYANRPLGVDESQPLDFHSPYGCSKGAGDQYVRDYARIYDLRSVVLRQSCIYGPRQFGVEDQGWLAWFMIAAVEQRPVTICGDGKQLRDVLFVDDLLDLYDAVVANIEKVRGAVYNVGGGAENTVSIWQEFGPMLEKLVGCQITVRREAARAGDQRVYVSDIRKALRDLGWRPRVRVEEGMGRLFRWVRDHQPLFAASR